jgi:hypothetical protein
MSDGVHSRDALGRQILQAMLRQVSTLFGRLEFLASLRNTQTGKYEHAVLAQVIDPGELDQLLRQHHQQVFSEWLASNLEEQKADLTGFLRAPSRGVGAGAGLASLAAHADMIPPGARPVERQLYLTDWETLLELMNLGARDSGETPQA